jgi:hypothetical protein
MQHGKLKFPRDATGVKNLCVQQLEVGSVKNVNHPIRDGNKVVDI